MQCEETDKRTLLRVKPEPLHPEAAWRNAKEAEDRIAPSRPTAVAPSSSIWAMWAGSQGSFSSAGCLPKNVLGKGHSFHERHWGQVHPVCHIPHSIDAGYGCLIEAVHLDLTLGTQLHPNLQCQGRRPCWVVTFPLLCSHAGKAWVAAKDMKLAID